jgi:endonuclease-3
MEVGDISKRAFDIDIVMERVKEGVRPYPKAALFELVEEGFDSPFEVLLACLISIRTRDEVTLPTSRRLFARARTPAAVAQLAPEAIAGLIRACAFHERKAGQIQAIARRVVEEYAGDLPCDREVLLSFKGVGAKCAHLVLGMVCDEPRIGVDVHVHRITNRWGYVATSSPDRTAELLEERLPRRYWVDINRLLVPFGKHICTGQRPRCSGCSVLEMCQQVGVGARR